MTYYTEITNELVEMADGNNYRDENWRRTLTGKVQLKCPYCQSWFTLGKDFTIDTDGLVSDLVYHVCDNDSNDDEPNPTNAGWVVLPKLIGWNK